MSAVKEVVYPTGETVLYHDYEGFSIPEHFVKNAFPAKDLVLQMKWIKETEIRPDDVIICAFPKTGTHWTWEIVSMIQNGSPEYMKNTKVSAMLEFSTQEMTSSLVSPRVLNIHMTHNLLPEGIKRNNCKIIHVIRNPKDVFVSMYYHMKSDRPGLPSMDWYSKMFTGELGTYEFCSYLWYIKHFEQFQRENPSYPIINVFYEKLKKNNKEEIARIAKFLEKDLDDEVIEAISEKCQFSNLKQVNDEWKNDPLKEQTKDGKSYIYRKGMVGDWKNHLTVAQNEKFDSWIQKEMEDSDIIFQYE